MCRTEALRRTAWGCAAALLLLLLPVCGRSAETASPRPNVHPKAAGDPIRMAVFTTAVQTPVFVRAYDQFCSDHGQNKLLLELWVEQEWADSPRPLDLAGCDMILALRCSIPGLDEAIAAAAAGGAWVVGDSSRRDVPQVDVIDDLPDLAPYYRQRRAENIAGLLEAICQAFGVPDVQPRPAVAVATSGIYHPDADRIFADAESYWEWYAERPGFDPQALKVGMFVYNTLYLNEETDYFTELVRGLERAGANPVLGFWFLPVGRDDAEAASPIGRFFAGVDVLLSSSFRLSSEEPCHADQLRQLDVPVLNCIILNDTREQWRQSHQGIAASYLLPGIVTPEVAGLIEPTVIAARQRVSNPQTGQPYFRTVVIEQNYQWQIRRALAWARLRQTPTADRRVAILFYNHSGGKQNIGASYLNVTASLERILADLRGRGYRVDGAVDRQAIIDSMLAVGRNVGQWAPGEVDRLLESGAILWPVEKYLAHYDRLPEAARRRISQQWGQPPGDIMTVTRDGQRCFVLPAFQAGNLLLAPQPARASASGQDSAYHDPLLWPTHQYLAFYFWLQHEWRAGAVVHLGRHGTLEFLPGKSTGLAWDDPPALALGDLPNIYPYIVDGIGEAVAAKRRGQAVLLTHATPPLTGTGLYGDLARLQELINRHAEARDQGQSGLQAEYCQSILELAAELGYSRPPAQQMPAAPHEPDPPTVAEPHTPAESSADRSGDEAEVHRVEHWLVDIQMQTAPRGLHTFGDSYSPEAVEDMLRRMFPDELAELDETGEAADATATWLAAAARGDAPRPAAAQTPPAEHLPGAGTPGTVAARARIQTAAWHMRHNQELEFLSRALDARFVPAGPPGDPLSNPDIFPTGRNQYQHNPAKLPTPEAWAVGRRMAEQALDLHRQRHGADPHKLSITLWANTLIRTHGALESQVLHLLGVEPVWDRRGDVVDVQLLAPLDRPRVDVVMTLTGMYRDSFPDKVLLLDKAVRLAQDAPTEARYANHVQAHTRRLARELIGRGASSDAAHQLATLRIFGPQTGQYGSGIDNVVQASESWTQRGEVADQYLQRMSFGFSADGWSQPVPEVFRQQLRGVQGVIHGRSSNLYGIIDLTENFAYQGGLALAVESLDGQQPDLYINDLVRGQQVLTGRQAIVLELLSRYHNPDFIQALMADGYDGARYLSRIADNQFGWDVVSDLVTAEDWKQFAEIYLEDRHQLGLRQFFEQHNPHALQNIASRILETHRKGLHKLDPRTLQTAARVYVETIAEHGAACASHVCGNPELAGLAEEIAAASAELAPSAREQFRRQLRRTGNPELAARGGASDQPASAPQTVQGRVLTAPPPPTATAGEPPPSPPRSSAAESPPSNAASPDPSRAGLATLLAGILSAGAFGFGVLWRAARNRPAR